MSVCSDVVPDVNQRDELFLLDWGRQTSFIWSLNLHVTKTILDKGNYIFHSFRCFSNEHDILA